MNKIDGDPPPVSSKDTRRLALQRLLVLAKGSVVGLAFFAVKPVVDKTEVLAMLALPSDGGFRGAVSGESSLEQAASSKEKEEVKEFFRLAGQAYSYRFSTDGKPILAPEAEKIVRERVENDDYILHETKVGGTTVYWLETKDGIKEDNRYAISVAEGELMRVEGDLVKPRYGFVSDLPEFVNGAHFEMNKVTGKLEVLDYGGKRMATADRTRNRGLAFEPNVSVRGAIEFYLNGLHFEGPGAEEISRNFKDEILNMEELPTVDEIMKAYRNERRQNPKDFYLNGKKVNMDAFNLANYFPEDQKPSLRVFLEALSKVEVVRITPGLEFDGVGYWADFYPGTMNIKYGLEKDSTISIIWKEMFVAGSPEMYRNDPDTIRIEKLSHAQMFALIYGKWKRISQRLAFTILTRGFPIIRSNERIPNN